VRTPSTLAWRILVFEGVLAAVFMVIGVTGEFVPAKDPWLQTQPAHAEAHYGQWRSTVGDWAHPAWHSFWIKRNPPKANGPVLVDRRHSRKQLLDTQIGENEYRYNRMHGLGSLGRELEQRGVGFQEIFEPLTGRTLGGASMIFINLPSGDGPDFSHAEVLSLEAFVRAGGGLVLLTDHTNAYFHGEMLSPLARVLGFEMPPVTACDKAPGQTMSPRSTTWIVPRTDGEHVVLRGVDRLGLMTAGALVPLSGSDLTVLAKTSQSGWQDHWNPYKKSKSAGLTGNMAQDPDEPDEAVPVLLAGSVGQGRVVVLSDQNAWGSIMIGMEDNFQLALNAFSWARGAGNDWVAPSPAVEMIAGEAYSCGTVSKDGFHTLFVSMARHAAIQGRRHSCRAGPGEKAATRIWLPGTQPSAADLLASSRTVWMSAPEQDLGEVLGDSALLHENLFFSLWVMTTGQQVLVIENAEWLSNAFLGKERVDPAKSDAQTQRAHQFADAVLAWTYGQP
jgi:hypothetical protein